MLLSPRAALPLDRIEKAVSSGRRAGAALVASIAVGVLSFAIALLSFFIGNGQNPAVFEQAAGYFTPATLVLILLLAIACALGAVRETVPALVTGLAASLVASVTGTFVGAVAAGLSDVRLWAFAFGSIVSLNLVFVLAATLLTGFLAPGVRAAVLGAGFGRPRRIALVRIPASNLDEAELTHVERRAIDAALADEQWENYCAALGAEGWDVVEVDATPELADSVFVEDAVVFFGDLAVLARSGAESRRAELASVERAVRSIPGVVVERILEPGTLDGGDVLKVGDTVYVGSGSRTNAEGIRQLRSLLDGSGCRVVAVPVDRVLHLKSAVTALPDGTVIGHPELLDGTALFPRFLPVPEKEGVAVVELSADTLLMSAAAPRTAQLVAGLGYRVVTVDIGEFEKLEGCVTCLSVRVR